MMVLRFEQNGDRQLAIPRNHRRAALFLGVGIAVMAVTLSGSAFIPLAVTHKLQLC